VADTDSRAATQVRELKGVCPRILDPEVKNPQTQRWERAFRVFDLLL
jgi:hypothetical protein